MTRPALQVALDYTVLDPALDAARRLAGHVDIIEAGTLLCFACGMDAVRALITEVALVVPQVRYVGWDIVATAQGPVLVEGNWGAGVFENKPTATGIRHGHLPRYRAAMGF